MNDRYESVDWQMVKLDDVEKEWIQELKKSPKNPIEKLNKVLEKYII